ncbi:hypothetical protein HHL22_11915 [Hymenobacter sp. RP-2-7]|uniref:Uncharacterized protein n=1 Tax=Hymenobacter polaris TaxID=2682546 RepID=A0A7Y0AEW3_9BACT|nr:hypothetical protein [Hymenobacter polaris]NML65912.1 hypothetical protein [Hymenobacter polaris]
MTGGNKNGLPGSGKAVFLCDGYVTERCLAAPPLFSIMLRYSFVLAVALTLSVCGLLFVPQWFIGQYDSSINIGYLVFGIPTAVLALLLGLHMWERHTTQRLRGEIAKGVHERYTRPNVRMAPSEVLDSLHIYNEISLRNYWAYRVLGVVSLASSLFLAVALGTKVSVTVTKILAFVSSLSTGIIFSFSLVEKSNRARRAFRTLHYAVMLYQHGEIEIRELLDLYSQAEDQLGDDEFKGGSVSNSATAK